MYRDLDFSIPGLFTHMAGEVLRIPVYGRFNPNSSNQRMRKRRQADRAEAIVRGVGTLVMLLVLLALVRRLPVILNGNDPRDAIGTMLELIAWFVLLGGLVIVVGLMAWFRVRNSARRGADSKASALEP